METILIIDDCGPFREMLRDILADAGFIVVEADNGLDAVGLYRKNEASLAIVDLIIPEKEGIETLSELRQAFPDARLIAISGGGCLGAQEFLNKAREAGVSHTFSKPFDLNEMVGTVRNLLAKNQV